jgi:hypothetical protein
MNRLAVRVHLAAKDGYPRSSQEFVKLVEDVAKESDRLAKVNGEFVVLDYWGVPINYQLTEMEVRIWSNGPNKRNDLGMEDDQLITIPR